MDKICAASMASQRAEAEVSLQTLRFTLLDQPVRIVRPAGRTELRFAVSSLTRRRIMDAEHRIQRAA